MYGTLIMYYTVQNIVETRSSSTLTALGGAVIPILQLERLRCTMMN